MNKRKICVITGTRAEYGLMYWLIKEIDNDPDLVLQLVVTGMHLSPEFGLTFNEIIKDKSIDISDIITIAKEAMEIVETFTEVPGSTRKKMVLNVM